LIEWFAMDTLVSNESLTNLYDRLKGRWVGCDWPTEFGPSRLNLQSMTADQAALLGRATCGSESIQWREAARFLAQIESDAKAARRAAELACHHAVAGRPADALAHAHRACDLERRYHSLSTWEPLEEAIRKRLVAIDSNSVPTIGVAYIVPTAERA
jgi:hypothetical protein